MRQLKISFLLPGLLCLVPGWAGAIEPDPCIPPDTVLVAQIRPRQLMTSALVKDQGWDEVLKSTLASIGPVADFLDTSGLRIERDAESLLLCMSTSPFTHDEVLAIDEETGQVIPPKAGEKPPENWLVIARGKFSPKKLGKALENQGKASGAPVKKIKDNGQLIFQLNGPAGDVFIWQDGNSKIYLGNNLPYIRGCIAGGFNKPIRRELQGALEKIIGEESLWVVQGLDQDARKSLADNDDLKDIAKELNSGIFTLSITDGVKGSYEVLTGSRAAAEAVKVSLVKMFQEVDQDLDKELKEFFESKEEHDPLEKLGFMAEVGIALAFIRNSNLAVKGTDFSCTVDLNKKKVDKLLEFFNPGPK